MAKIKDYIKKSKEKNLYKFKARWYANHHKQRDTSCSKCGSLENLEFHHTDYKRNKGITLCKNCHNNTHFGGVTDE